jgi:hypothetical protein
MSRLKRTGSGEPSAARRPEATTREQASVGRRIGDVVKTTMQAKGFNGQTP